MYSLLLWSVSFLLGLSWLPKGPGPVGVFISPSSLDPLWLRAWGFLSLEFLGEEDWRVGRGRGPGDCQAWGCGSVER